MDIVALSRTWSQLPSRAREMSQIIAGSGARGLVEGLPTRRTHGVAAGPPLTALVLVSTALALRRRFQRPHYH